MGEAGAILTGPSGCGKSDLALRFILETPQELAPCLVSDDQVLLKARGGKLFAFPPPTIAGRLEVRGIGIMAVPHCAEAEVKLLIRLDSSSDIPRLPPSPLPVDRVCGVTLDVISIAPYEISAHLKLRLALQRYVQ